MPFNDVALQLRENDDVAVLKRALPAGAELVRGSLRMGVTGDVPAGHKIALRALPDGAAVRKYGQIIGFARGAIAPGDHVHTHNLVVKQFARDCEFGAEVKPVAFHPPEQTRCFAGYARAGGRVGTRNYLAVISTVNCSASVAQFVRQRSVEVRRRPIQRLVVEAAPLQLGMAT